MSSSTDEQPANCFVPWGKLLRAPFCGRQDNQRRLVLFAEGPPMSWFSKRSEPSRPPTPPTSFAHPPAKSADRMRRTVQMAEQPRVDPSVAARIATEMPPGAQADAPAPSQPPPNSAAPSPTRVAQERHGPPGADTDPTRTFAALMRIMLAAPETQSMTIGQLRALLDPAIATGDFLVASHGATVAAIMWAMTDDATDLRLRTDLAKPLEIAPSDWCSGPHAWIVAVIGDQAWRTSLSTYSGV
jgi:hemolysin-activating ACP:hemolysin acyltransferase